ncbi:RecB family nuclease, putative, TM0106 family [Halorientalis regularis]|uniref:RecB family nuclease, putative, TM0106 family n=2 Tax=Halorientalis regularis TaxID=660518 RepID=A0A1G7TQS3_9EURY|nr:ribonuclease H-like domain-containing protein [Halorientalis regularis]SDG37648.1 RecB family nuclease, putative, TM0106 family [Halorientalis regularis]
MRIFAFSDWRTQPIEPLYEILENIDPSPDLILYGGDDVRRFVDTTQNHFHKLAKTVDADLGFVLGNDDHPENLQHLKLQTSRVTDLHRNPLEKDGIALIGQSGDIGSTAMGYIQYPEEEATKHLETLHSKVSNDIIALVSHTPPHGTLDYAQRYESGRIGSHAVKKFASNTGPLFVLCGHVHQFGGETAHTDYSPVLNVASHDFEQSPGRIAIIDILEDGRELNLDIRHTTVKKCARDLQGVGRSLAATSSLSRLTQVGGTRVEELKDAGMATISDIAAASKAEMKSATTIPEYFIDKIQAHATAYAEQETIIRDAHKFAALRDDETVLIDIETNLEQDRVWCIGLYSYPTDEFTQLVSLDDEQSLIERFQEYLLEQRKPRLIYYAGNSFDEGRLSEAADRCNVALAELVDEWVDLCVIARETIFQPEEGHDLDAIASGLGFLFEHPNVTGLEIGGAFSTYQSEGEVPDDGWEKYLEYNRDDTLAIKHILDFMSQNGPNEETLGRIDERNSPEDRDDYGIAEAPITAETESEAVIDSSVSETQSEDTAHASEPLWAKRDPYDVIENKDPIAHWTESDPINAEASSVPLCSACGRMLVEEDERKQLTVDNESRYLCQSGCGETSSKNSGCKKDTSSSDHNSEPHSDPTQVGSTDRSSSAAKVICHDCGDLVREDRATGKLRINDGQTLWYCPTCT